MTRQSLLMTRQDALRRIMKKLSMAGEILREIEEIAREHSLGFSTSRELPFELKYDNGLWKAGDVYWQESGCTIGLEDFDDWKESSWNSSSANCA